MKTREAVLREIEQRTAMLVLTAGLSAKQAHKQAMREVAVRERAAGAAAGAGPPDSASSLPTRAHAELLEICERWISHIWSRAEESMARVRRKRRTEPKPTIPEPSMQAAPVVVYEPSPPLSNDPKLAKNFPAPLIISDFSSARIIPNAEFPQRYIDPTTENFRSSILQNEAIAKEKAARSLARQNRNRAGSRYIG
jgi:hypothetical protein